MIMGGNKRTVPLLYEGEWDDGEGSNLINKTKMVEEIKNAIFFKRKYKEDDKEIIIEAENILNSPLYTGALKLVGVLEHTDKASSIAILEFKRKQNLYLEGDKIEGITIIKILTDRIIVNENGGHYTLVIL
ncbi:type II secretion system protein N [Yersinia kristensenii]|uniref:type II secretion system protein N n=1 Tax=Yersinia kristensenii TaxID=28152 RepID=UPI003896DC2C